MNKAKGSEIELGIGERRHLPLIEVANNYRCIYRNMIMQRTLEHALPDTEIKIPLFDPAGEEENEPRMMEFKGSFIFFIFGSGMPNNVWSMHTVQATEKDNPFFGHVVVKVANEVLTLSPHERKAIYAHEYLEAMQALKEGKRATRTLDGKKPRLVTFFDGLGAPPQRVIFQDSIDFELELEGALRQLLVSSDSLDASLRDNIPEQYPQLTKWSQLTGWIEKDPKQAEEYILNFADDFSKKWAVHRSLVFDRLREHLLQVS